MAIAYNPVSKTLFIPLNNLSMKLRGRADDISLCARQYVIIGRVDAISLDTDAVVDATESFLLVQFRCLTPLSEVQPNNQPGCFPMSYMAGRTHYLAVPVGISLIGYGTVKSTRGPSRCSLCPMQIPGREDGRVRCSGRDHGVRPPHVVAQHACFAEGRNGWLRRPSRVPLEVLPPHPSQNRKVKNRSAVVRALNLRD